MILTVDAVPVWFLAPLGFIILANFIIMRPLFPKIMFQYLLLP